MLAPRTILYILAIVFTACAHAQQAIDTISTAVLLSQDYPSSIINSSEKLDAKLDKATNRALVKWKKTEERLIRKLSREDSAKAKELLTRSQSQYKELEERLQNPQASQQYISSLDTLNTSLNFLERNARLSKASPEQIKTALNKLSSVKNNLQKAEVVKQFLKERRQWLQNNLSQSGLAKELTKLNKQVYYYSTQISEYKNLLRDHRKAVRKGIELLSKTKAFKDFMRKNSQLASLFRMASDPNDPVDPAAQASLAGLQTRAQVNNLIQQQIAAGGPNAQRQVQQNLQEAQAKLGELKNKVSQWGGNSDDETPQGFKPNTQKTKNFFQRLEVGTNIQSQKANGYLPTTSDLAFSLGYKLNDKSIIGVGAGYKVGWGQTIRRIRMTHQGAGLRSFVDWKIKGNFWISGGYEMNYRAEFRRVEQLKDLNAWQQSGLLGLSKVISVKSKLLKKTKVQLLWDFLSSAQIPRTQPILFRLGYTL
jgi:hypothetical protein